MDFQKARGVYEEIRNTWIGGGAWLEPHERVGLLITAAGIRSFAFLSYVDKKLWDSTSAALSKYGLQCAPCDDYFDYDLDTYVPEDIASIYRTQQLKDPLRGLGVCTFRGKLIRAILTRDMNRNETEMYARCEKETA